MSAERLAQLGSSQRRAAKAIGMSSSALSRALATGLWPTRGGQLARQKYEQFLSDLQNEVGPGVLAHAEAVPAPVAPLEDTFEQEETMLLQNAALTPEARRHFNLPRNPFVDDVQSSDDVFQTASVRYVRASLLDCAQHHGFMAVVGESGAGKSTLAEDLEERIRTEGREVVVIRPYVLAMEESDAKGKPMKSGQIAEAVVRTLDLQGIRRKHHPRVFWMVRVLEAEAAKWINKR